MAEDDHRLAETLRAACLAAAREAYDDAGLRGLCAEGRWEAAIGAIHTCDLAAVVRAWRTPHGPAE